MLPSQINIILLGLILVATNLAITETKTLELIDHHQRNTTNSPWLIGVDKSGGRMGCRRRPGVCGPQRLCCRNRCVDVSSDPNNCGFCRVRCRFAWQCCRGICRNVNVDPLNCGRCDNRCRLPELCVYGLCGYADFPYPFPDPRRRRRRRRPFPYPEPFPPRGGRGWGPPPEG